MARIKNLAVVCAYVQATMATLLLVAVAHSQEVVERPELTASDALFAAKVCYAKLLIKGKLGDEYTLEVRTE